MRLFALVFLLFAAPVLVGGVVMAMVLSWNLDRGFQDYLLARDGKQLDTISAEMIARGEDMGGLAALDAGTLKLAQLLPPRIATEMLNPKVPLPSGSSDVGVRGERDGPRAKRVRPPEAFSVRLSLFQPNGTQEFGPRPPRGRAATQILRRELLIDGRIIGTLTLLPRGPTPEAADAGFLTRQYKLAGLALAALVLLGLLPAWWVARHSGLMLSQIKAATAAIAKGSYVRRAPDSHISELAALSADINKMADDLSRLDTARRRWLADISHELRTPLTALRGELDALHDGIRQTTPAAMISLREETLHLSQLVEDLHYLAISDLSGPVCSFEAVDAAALCAATMTRFEERGRSSNLQLSFELAGNATGNGDGNWAAVWDARRIGQVLDNLLVNSLRYTDAPGCIRLRLQDNGAQLHISVQDSAPAAEAKDIPHLFEPLFRGAQARARGPRVSVADMASSSNGGSGLGLAVCADIVKAHGGQISAAPSDLGGLHVTVVLPRHASHNLSAQP